MACLCLTTIWHESQAQDAPKTPQDIPKMATRRVKKAPRHPKTHARDSQDPPSGPNPEALRGRISPLSNLLSEYAESHSIHHTFIYWKFSRNHKKPSKTVQDQHIGASELSSLTASEPPSAGRQAPRRDSRSANNFP